MPRERLGGSEILPTAVIGQLKNDEKIYPHPIASDDYIDYGLRNVASAKGKMMSLADYKLSIGSVLNSCYTSEQGFISRITPTINRRKI